MKKILLLILLLTGFGNAIKYEVTHIKKGKTLNVREKPSLRDSSVIERLPSTTTEINIKECTELENGQEWCYIRVPRGGSHIEGWVSSYFLRPMTESSMLSRAHITNFLHNFYLADEENYLDKLQVFYSFPMQKYLYNKNLSLMELRQKKVNFYKKWPKRNYRLSYMKVLKRASNYIDVQTTIDWKVESNNDYNMGKDIHKIRLIPTGSTFKVSALKYLRHTVYPKPEPIILEEENSTVVTTAEESSVPLVKNLTTNSKDKNRVVYIKAGSFFSEVSKEYLSDITKNGFPYMIQKVYQGKKVIRRVFIGPFESRVSAENVLGKVRSKINKYAYIQSSINR